MRCSHPSDALSNWLMYSVARDIIPGHLIFLPRRQNASLSVDPGKADGSTGVQLARVARLLDRLPAGAVPTNAGTRLLTYAAQMLDLEGRLLADVPATSGQPAGHVRLVAPESLCGYRLPPLLRDVRQVAPHVRLTLAPASTAQALRAVREGTADVALLLEPRITAADVRLVPLGSEDLTALAAPDLALPAPAVTWAHLADYDVLLLEDGCSYSDDVERRLLAVGQPNSRRIPLRQHRNGQALRRRRIRVQCHAT